MYRARGTLWIRFIKNYSLPCHLAPQTFWLHAWVKKCRLAISQKLADWLDWPCPVSSVHRKWPEMVVSASTNQVWTKITMRSYAWSFGHSDQDPSNVSRLSLVGEPRTSFSQSFWCSPWHIHDTSFTIHLCTKTGMKNEKKIYLEDLLSTFQYVHIQHHFISIFLAQL